MIFSLCKWYFDINWHKFEKRWADVFQIYPNAIHLNPLQFCPSMPLLGFPVFCLSSSIVLNRYFHILVNSMTIWSVLKLPKIAWPSPFNHWWRLCVNFWVIFGNFGKEIFFLKRKVKLRKIWNVEDLMDLENWKFWSEELVDGYQTVPLPTRCCLLGVQLSGSVSNPF